MALYRFLFAPALLALAVVAGRSPEPQAPPASAPVELAAPAGTPPSSPHAALERAPAPRPVRAR